MAETTATVKPTTSVQATKSSNIISFKSTLRVNPNELLQAVESELDQTFKEKTITKLKQAKSAFVNRNYD